MKIMNRRVFFPLIEGDVSFKGVISDLTLSLCSGAAKEPGALPEPGGAAAADPPEEHRSAASTALQPLVQTLLRRLSARVQPAEVTMCCSAHTEPHHLFTL